MKIRWLVIPWVTYAAIFLIVRFAITGPNEALFTGYVVGNMVIVGIFGRVHDTRFRRDLKQTDLKVWEQLTNFPGVGPGYYNGFAGLSWISQPASSIPSHLKPLWLRARKAIWIPITWFLTNVLMMLILAVGAPSQA